MEKQISFRMGKMEKQQSFRIAAMEKQKSFRIALGRQMSLRKPKDSPGKRGDSMLHLASRGGNLCKIMEIFQSTGLDDSNAITNNLLSKQNQEGETPLYVAAENGHSHVVIEFLKHLDLQTASIAANNGYDPFHIAAKQGHLAAAQGHIDVVNLLLDADSNLAKIARNNGKTVLHTAARMGHLEVAKSVLSKDPSIGFRIDKKGQTALHMAVKGQNIDIVVELIKPDPTIVKCLLSFEEISINAVNKAGESPLDIAENLKFSEMVDILREAGAVHSKDYGKPPSAAKQLKQTVSDIKHDVQSQIRQTRQTGFRVRKIAKKVKKLHISGLNNAINSATVVAVLIATVAFAAIFTVPGQYVEEKTDGFTVGQAHIAKNAAFILFFLFDSLALFISLAVVVVQTSIVVIEEKAKRQLMFVINKLMWLACLFISVAFISLTYVVVGTHERWLAIYATVIGATIMLTTIGSMCYCVVRHRLEETKMRNIRRAETHSHSFSMSMASDAEYSEKYKRMYAV
ncbi:Ankyrin repeat-containing protein [Cynara cardunculus var. scolymus]|uniref:Ankyrin repeat-containing protein n=1 Tax=Cynara cardunculus var. scolymus TaxID=59895 RepID=A0A103Y0T5_CYNCS|nr:Ankyrin repeat-containing protein [Cynara cardunculus var. scolymus]